MGVDGYIRFLSEETDGVIVTLLLAGVLGLLVFVIGCALSGGDGGTEKKDEHSGDDDRTLFD